MCRPKYQYSAIREEPQQHSLTPKLLTPCSASPASKTLIVVSAFRCNISWVNWKEPGLFCFNLLQREEAQLWFQSVYRFRLICVFNCAPLPPYQFIFFSLQTEEFSSQRLSQASIVHILATLHIHVQHIITHHCHSSVFKILKHGRHNCWRQSTCICRLIAPRCVSVRVPPSFLDMHQQNPTTVHHYGTKQVR